MKSKKTVSALLASLLILVWIVICVLVIYMSFSTYVDGQWIPNTPVPTATPEEFSVTVEILQFDKNVGRACCIDVLWVARILESDRPQLQGKYFLGLKDGSKLELKPGTKIQLMCTGVSWLDENELSCSQEYKIIQ